ncbi:bacteriohemerythrin [Motiliproteus sp. MSK22-1]|uniref:bacteriohemerythrin n=1 Tax=Motiliproteus sp. MSK22-1 TaxID=1897630 RepID=UPI000977BFED|nr:bacteriohemerythrin [Motiliproteus sp. MSK22-1]OMH25892.1 hypothetical protein BGP75_25615 [Motiliproteus sp. MSK22-1]
MALFVWEPRFETGQGLIDTHHRKLVELINALGEAVAHNSQQSGAIADVYRQLVDYTRYHFSSEEKLMQQAGMDQLAFQQHQETHRSFICSLESYSDESFDQATGEALLDYLVKWLSKHILLTDKQMVEALGIGSISSKEDLDPQKLVAAQLLSAYRESEERFRSLADSTPAMMWLSGIDGSRSFFNQSWLLHTSQILSEADGNGWQSLIHEDDKDAYLERYHCAHRTHVGFNAELRVNTIEGRTLWLLETANPRYRDNGEFIGCSGCCVDISAQKKAQLELERLNLSLEEQIQEQTLALTTANEYLLAEAERRHSYQNQLEKEKLAQQQLIDKLQQTHDQLLQSEKMSAIGQLAAGVAHEINNPVGYVSSNLGTLTQYVSNLQTLLKTYEELESHLEPGGEAQKQLANAKQSIDYEFINDDIADLLKESQEGVERVSRIVKDLKDFSHVDQGEWLYADLHKCIDSTLNVVWNELKYKAEVVKEYSDLPEVYCLASQLNQVFMNLLINAAHAIKDHGTITIRTRAEDEQIWVEIQDTGCGISEEVKKRIFEPFYTTKEIGTGTGLGLSLSYGIIEKHQGHIEVESKEGEGSRFRVCIPLWDVEEVGAPPVELQMSESHV